MPEPKITDKAELSQYLQSIAAAVTSACQRIETATPAWRVTSGEIIVRCALRPAEGGAVYADMDVSRSQQVSEIPLRFERLER